MSGWKIPDHLFLWFTLLLFLRYQASLHRCWFLSHQLFSKSFLLSCKRLMRHVFFGSLCPWAWFLDLSNSQLIVSYSFRGFCPCFWQLLSILVQSLFGLLGASSHRGWAKLPLLFLHSLTPKAYSFMSLGFLLPILIGSWLDWAFPILEASLVLDFNTCNILDLNNLFSLS